MDGLGLELVASATLYEGKLTELFNLNRLMNIAGRTNSGNDEIPAVVSLPASENSLAQLFGLLLVLRERDLELKKELEKLSDVGVYPSSLDVVRSTSRVLSALAGMECVEYVKEHLRLAQKRKIDAALVDQFWSCLAPCVTGSPST